ncbi:hypothetical protein C8F04DRAFT_895105, partial [Mycena alexandri]
RAEAERTKVRREQDLKEKWMERADDIFLDGQDPSTGEPKYTLQGALDAAKAECLAVDKKIVILSLSTLQRHVTGGRSIRDAHEEQKWLSKAEAKVVIDFAIACADRGFPLSH